MNIGILIPGFSANEQDWCIPVYLNYVRMLAEDHYVRVFPFRYPYTTEPYEVYGAHVFPFDGGSYTHGLDRGLMLWDIQQAIKKHHKIRPFDVLHAFWADETGYLANRLGKQLGVPSVVSIAGGELVGFREIDYGLQLGRITSWLVLQAIKNASAVVAPSLYSARMLRDYAAYHRIKVEKRTQVVPLGVDTQLFKLPTEENRPREFLHVGSLNPVKRQDWLLRLLAKMPTFTLDIVGDGEMREGLGSLAKKLGIADRVIFHGEVAHDELPAFYQSARWLLMTSQHEAFCMVAAEAAACGTGVIGSAVGAIPEIGYAANVGSLEEMLGLIVARKRSEPLKWRVRRHEFIQQHFSLERMVGGMMEIYTQLSNKKRR